MDTMELQSIAEGYALALPKGHTMEQAAYAWRSQARKAAEDALSARRERDALKVQVQKLETKMLVKGPW